MTQYKCGKFTVEILHYGNKLVFLRDGSGEEFTVQRDYFDEKYKVDVKLEHGNPTQMDYPSLIKVSWAKILR